MKRTPLKRKTPLKRTGWKRTPKPQPERKPRTPLKQVSDKQRQRLREYYAVRAEFLAKPENQLCEICAKRIEAGEDIRQNAASEVHHRAGRIGKALCDPAGMCSSCLPCRMWPHDHPAQARAMGLLV